MILFSQHAIEGPFKTVLMIQQHRGSSLSVAHLPSSFRTRGFIFNEAFVQIARLVTRDSPR